MSSGRARWASGTARRDPLYTTTSKIEPVYDSLVEKDTARVKALVDQPHRPPTVTVALPDEQVQAVLLIWGRSLNGGGWRAGVCYIHRTWHSRALVTTWAPAVRVSPHVAAKYEHVPRIDLLGDPSQWPPLPPRYPDAGPEWIAVHQHLTWGSAPRPPDTPITTESVGKLLAKLPDNLT